MDGACVCVVLKVLASRVRRHYYERKGWLVLEEGKDLLRDRLKNVFSLLWWCQCMPPTFVHLQDPCGQEKGAPTGGSIIVNHTFFTRDWLENFWMPQATFFYVCDELRSTIEKADTEIRKAIPAEQSCFDTLVSSNHYWLSHEWSSVWSFKGYCVHGD